MQKLARSLLFKTFYATLERTNNQKERGGKDIGLESTTVANALLDIDIDTIRATAKMARTRTLVTTAAAAAMAIVTEYCDI